MPLPTKNSMTKVGAVFNIESHTGLQESTLNHVSGTYLAAIIADPSNNVSVVAARKLINSIEKTKSDLYPVIVPATTPEKLKVHLANYNLTTNNWTYPSNRGKTIFDIKTGMKLTGYNAKDINKVIACAVSHLRIWTMCVAANIPIVVLEHDALFTRKMKVLPIEEQYGIIGLNDPRGATRKSNVYLQKVLDNRRGDSEVVDVPYVDDDTFAPQGLAGNSAYLIYPNAANHLISKIEEVGLWPNDALMCKQFFPFLRQAYPFYTTLQGVPSTTQG
jgi:hypothetical protein